MNHTKHLEKLNAWTAIFRNHKIVPFSLPGNLKGGSYLEFMESALNSVLIEIIEKDQQYPEENPIFQQDSYLYIT